MCVLAWAAGVWEQGFSVYSAEAHADTTFAVKPIPQYLAQVCYFLLSGHDMNAVFHMLQLETFGSFNWINFYEVICPLQVALL